MHLNYYKKLVPRSLELQKYMLAPDVLQESVLTLQFLNEWCSLWIIKVALWLYNGCYSIEHISCHGLGIPMRIWILGYFDEHYINKIVEIKCSVFSILLLWFAWKFTSNGAFQIAQPKYNTTHINATWYNRSLQPSNARFSLKAYLPTVN